MTLRSLVLLILVGCASPTAVEESGRPNILLILSDDQRPDTIAPDRTPHLHALAEAGTTFTRAVCPNPICVPSRVEILTGCDGFRNGVSPRLGAKPGAGRTAWPAAMRSAGYHTWFSGKWHTVGKPRDYGYEESRGLFASGMGAAAPPRRDLLGRVITGYGGWVFQDEDGRQFPEKGVGLTEETDVHIADGAAGFLERRPRRPFFLQVSFTSPHDPLMPPASCRASFDPAAMTLPPNYRAQHPFDHGNAAGRDEALWPTPRVEKEVREDLAQNLAAIAHLDAQEGRILEALRKAGLTERTIVIFASDHGLAIGSHGLRGKQNMYEHTVGVPLIIAGPGLPRGARSPAQVYLRELYPTVCDLAGVPVPGTVEGKSFARVLRGKAGAHHEAVFGYFEDRQRMVRTDRWKLIRYPRIDRLQLFDLSRDPFELEDLSASPAHAATRDELLARLAAWQKTVGDPLLDR